MSTVARSVPHRMHIAWPTFAALEVLAVAITLALDFTVAGFVMAAVAVLSVPVHRHGFGASLFRHGPPV